MATTTWFEQGVSAFQRARPGAPACYPCPVCLRGFPTEDGLSPDHFPPQTRGGKHAVLTCTGCNNRAGSELEADMDPAEILYEFAAGEMSQPTRGQIMIDGRTLNADILAFGTDVSITVPKGVNNPTAERALIQRLGERKKKKDWTDIEIKLSFGKHRIEDALAGWLRSAYLAVFSAWGYSYILRPQLDAVREQIQRPDSNVLKVFSFSMPSPAFDEAHIALIDRPQSLAGHLLVVMERHAIFLPGLPDRDLYGELARQSEAGMEANVSAKKEVPWPVRPRFELDFAPSSDN